jgi:hypothetical protein
MSSRVTYVTADELRNMAARAVTKSELSLRAVGEECQMSHTSVAKAIGRGADPPPASKYSATCSYILERLSERVIAVEPRWGVHAREKCTPPTP